MQSNPRSNVLRRKEAVVTLKGDSSVIIPLISEKTLDTAKRACNICVLLLIKTGPHIQPVQWFSHGALAIRGIKLNVVGGLIWLINMGTSLLVNSGSKSKVLGSGSKCVEIHECAESLNTTQLNYLNTT